MNTVLDNAVVAILLIASVAYAFAKLSPRNARRRAFVQLSAWLRNAPRSLRLAPLAERLALAADDKTGACGGCDGCGSEPRADASGGEIRVPIASILRTRPPRPE